MNHASSRLIRGVLSLPSVSAMLAAGAPALGQVACPPAGSGAAGIAAWAAANCSFSGPCVGPSVTCNSEFTIELVSVVDSGHFVTFEYEVCRVGGAAGLSFWTLGVDGLGCVGHGGSVESLIVGATLNGHPIPFEVVLDPTMQVYGVKFDIDPPAGNCHTWGVTIDTSRFLHGTQLVTGCVVAATKAGPQDITRFARETPGYACVEGPVCTCYPDCDHSTGIRVLDIFDFLCFCNRFHMGDPYACDCDTSTGPGVCDVFDFLCFGNAFHAGCF